MLFDLKPGDKVRFTDYLGEGTVFKVDDGLILVEDENGLLLHLTWKDVVPIFKPEKELPVYRESKNSELETKSTESKTDKLPKADSFDWENAGKAAIKKIKDKKGKTPVKDFDSEAEISILHNDEETGIPEIDLHLHQILEDETGMDDYDKLQYQLNVLKRELKRLHQLHAREAVIIHGVGKGRLREEVRALLAHTAGIADFFDASFKKYGAGATHVIFKQRSGL